jgi:hypothetical protein
VDPASSQSSYSVPFFKTLIRPLLVRWSTHPVAKMKLSADFLAASTPSSSVCLPLGRQAKLQQMSSTFVAWIGWSLSIDQIYTENDKFNMTRPFQ